VSSFAAGVFQRQQISLSLLQAIRRVGEYKGKPLQHAPITFLHGQGSARTLAEQHRTVGVGRKRNVCSSA
jgi:hypothetical protein